MPKRTRLHVAVNSEKSRLGWYEACERCRKRHIRCQRGDDNLPCQNCKKAKVTCSRGRGSIFRAVQYSSESGKLTNAPSQDLPVESLVESPIASPAPDLNVDTQQQVAAGTNSQSPEAPADDSLTATYTHENSVLFEDVANLEPGWHHIETPIPHSAHASLSWKEPLPTLSLSEFQTPTPLSSVLSPRNINTILWPLKTEYEASLFQYFLIELSPWFDYCDPQKHFRNHVANAAAVDRTLLLAIFAVSARHQSASSGRPSVFAEECQENCLNSLILALNDYDTTVGETVFASALILRLIEEMTEPHPGADTVSHTLSAQLLIRIRAGNITTSVFTDAAFIVTLRQEIFVANLTQRPVGSITEHCNIDASLGPTSEPMWAYRAIALAARVTDFAYDNSVPRTKERWEELMQYLYDWEIMRPPSFSPIFRKEQGLTNDTFPRLWFCSDYHVAASQYIELSRILLLASDPHTSHMRIGRLGHQGRKRDDAIRESVRLVCGVRLANRQHMGARSVAGLVISMCGELFSDAHETRVLLELVSDAESHLAWPSLKLKEELKRMWGLNEEDGS
ncbi:hypothetical protein BJX64DRAFT_286081 [Aspergillus heterothallicus]